MKILLLFALLIPTANSAFADNTAQTAAQPASATAPAAPKSLRSKNLSFDDSVVEGLNQNSKDSLEMTENGSDGNRKHLYQKRADFKKEIQTFPSELGYSP